MAIFYKTGTLNPLSTTLANDIRLAIVSAVNDAIAAGYTKYAVVDDGYVNGTTVRSVITHTDGWANMLINTTLTDNSRLELLTYFGQSYTVATHTLNNVGFANAADARTAAATGFSGANYAPPTPLTSAGNNTNPVPHGSNVYLKGNGNQNAWFAVFEQDYMYFSYNGHATLKGEVLFLGKFDTMVANPALTDTYPFGSFTFMADGFTQYARFTILHSLNNQSKNIRHSGFLWSFTSDGAPAFSTSYDKYSDSPNKAKMAPIYISRYGNYNQGYFDTRNEAYPPNDSNVNGWLRGKLPIVYHGLDTNANWGDTVSISGKTYKYVGGNGYTNAQNQSLAIWVEVP